MAEGPNGPRKGLMAENKDAVLVNDKRQKIQLLLAFDLDAKGEAQSSGARDESSTAKNESLISRRTARNTFSRRSVMPRI